MPRRLTGGFALALTALVAGSSTVAALPAQGEEPGYDPAQPEVTLEIKFDEALAVRGADDQLRSQRGRSLARVETALARYADYELQPLVPVAADRLEEVAARAQERAGESVPDLSSWYSLTLSPDVDAEAVADELGSLPEVVYAYPAPEPVPPPRAVETDTPDFTALQTYFGPSAVSVPDSNGIDAEFTRADPRLRGEGIKIVDLEYDWNPFHEDLQLQMRPEPDTANLAPAAAATCSYISPWESCDAINSGENPSSSNVGSPNDGTRWGTWPEGGSHWIQLTWDRPQEISVSDLYWFQDSTDGSNSGVKRPAEWSLQYWDGAQFVDVTNPSGYGTELNQYNRTTFDPVTTTQLRANLETRDDAQGVGALQWRAYTEPPADEPEPDETWPTDLGGGVFDRNTFFMDEHGTAVFGIMVAVDNDYGVTGGVPDAEMFGISPTFRTSSGGLSWRPGPALAFLAGLVDENGEPFLKPGDAVLLEQQTSSPDEVPGSFAPLEWIPSVFESIETLTAMGVNVVSTGGNGNTDSDHPGYTRDGVNGWFDPEFQHSGSILVGAGASGESSQPARSRLGFSNYGSRFDLQGWGQDIVTTGSGGNLWPPGPGGDVDLRYTVSFGGTSGAGPIVTSAVVAIQSYLKATGQEAWSAQEVADVLKATGVPQTTNPDQHIGPLPDLRAALKSIEVDPPETTLLLDGRPVRPGNYRNPVVTLDADDSWGAGVDRVMYRLDGERRWFTYDSPFQVTGEGEHTIEYRSNDVNGNTETVKSVTFTNRG